MKSPSEIAIRLASQWHQSETRVERLLSADNWPLELSIGKPTASEFSGQTASVQEHVQYWRMVSVGEVIWASVKYRSGAENILIPLRWRLKNPTEWVTASADAIVQREYAALEYFATHVNEIYREVLIRDRSLWRNKDLDDVVKAAALADSLFPGAAKGRPLRLLAEFGVDTKFIERNGILLTRFLDERYQGAAGEQGLHAFLDAYSESDHWVLVAAFGQRLMPFKRQRVTTEELAEIVLPSAHVLVIENEQCIHLLPDLPDTIVILGAGLDLQWLSSPVFDGKSVAYWGDMDTWGLLMLARARQYRSNVIPLLMDRSLFDEFAISAVPEPVVAQPDLPTGLTESEVAFYQHLLGQERGRLEQEYLPRHRVHEALFSWLS